MDFEAQLQQLAGEYRAKGYQIIIRPRPDDLPPFAKDFHVEILGKRNGDGVLVSVKRHRQEMAADRDMARYAAVTDAQPGWRYDFAILQPEDALAHELRGATEPSDEQIKLHLQTAEQLIAEGRGEAAFLIAWATLEAAMRRSLRVAGDRAVWPATPRTLLNELYANGIFSVAEFAQLEHLYQHRNRLAHGFAVESLDAGSAQSLLAISRRLLADAHPAAQPA
jgi:uncharacterized protein YutE (UPF0331/DUF86 family)